MKKAGLQSSASGWKIYTALAVLVVIVYLPLLHNGFITSWDDNRYILDNPLIRDFSFSGIAEMFSNWFDGHYHPLALLSLATDYAIGGYDPLVYHLHNLLLHIINTWLVFVIAGIILKGGKPLFAFIAALLFGVCTMHVESVAWAAERKNLLFSVFFFASLVYYLRLMESPKTIKNYYLSLLFFILALLSKATALALAPTIILIHYYYKKSFREKNEAARILPFLVLAIIAGLTAMMAQKATWGEDLSQVARSFGERIFFASLSFFLYMVKLFVPFNLSPFYPYPASGMAIPAGIGFTAAALLFSAGALWLFIRKRTEGFCLMFFIVNIFLLLKLFEVPAGDYYMADRYSYTASAGLFILAGYGLQRIQRRLIKPILIIAGGYIFFTMLLTFNRVMVWENEESFYTDILKQYPEESVAYNNRGAYRKQNGQIRSAFKDFSSAIQYAPDDYKGYANRAAVYQELDDYTQAAEDYRQALRLKPEKHDLWGSYGLTLVRTERFGEAIQALDKAIGFNPSVAEYYLNRGTARFSLGDLTGAINDYDLAIGRNKNYINAYFNRALAWIRSNNLHKAEKDLDRVILLNPNHAEAYMNRGVVLSRKGNMEQAFGNYEKAIQNKPDYAEAYLNRGIDAFHLKMYEQALADLNKVLSLNPALIPAYYFRGMVFIGMEEKEQGCKDLKFAAEGGFNPAASQLTTHCK